MQLSPNVLYACHNIVLGHLNITIGVARGGAVGAPAPPRAVKKNFSRPNLQEKCVSAPPQDTKCPPARARVNF